MTRNQESPIPYQLEWVRWENYREGPEGWIYPETKDFSLHNPTYSPYDPVQEPALPSEFARVGKENTKTVQKALMDFYRRFGLLGQTWLRGEPNKVVLDGLEQLVPGDQIGWALSHASNVERCVRLAGSLKKGRQKELKRSLRWVAEIRPKVFKGLPLNVPTLTDTYRQVHIRETPPQEDFESWENSEYLILSPKESIPQKARKLLATLLKPNLGSVERIYDPRTGRSVFKFKALIQLIYWQVADWINREGLQQCQECKVYFFARDRRQKFCPPTDGGRESRCSRRRRIREWRNQQKA